MTKCVLTPHDINRAEWERRFLARIAECAVSPEDEKLDAGAVAAIGAAELESWGTEFEDWTFTTPEDAADEQMSNWTDDQIP